MVSHHQSAKLQAGFDEISIGMVPQFYQVIVILEIGSVGCSSNITPLADNRVSKVSIVCFIAVAEDHRVAYFTTDL